jgi:hypothetical protein
MVMAVEARAAGGQQQEQGGKKQRVFHGRENTKQFPWGSSNNRYFTQTVKRFFHAI